MNQYITESVSLSPPATPQIEFLRLPAPKQRDAIFGLTRQWYYRHAAAGDIRLISLRKRGEVRGVALVDADSVRRFIDRCATELVAIRDTIGERSHGSA